jgi:Ca2+-binding RTX toxin-like protein
VELTAATFCNADDNANDLRICADTVPPDFTEIIYGLGGDDTLAGGWGADTLDGSEGGETKGDTVDYSYESGYAAPIRGVEVHLSLECAIDQYGYYDNVRNIENIIGTDNPAWADVLVGDEDGNRIEGLAGADTIYGEGGNDLLVGADGDDVADGGDGNDTIDLGPGNNFGFAGAGIDTVIGNSGQDVLFGQGDNDSLSGGDALDNLLAGPGNDTLDGGGAGDNMLGEAGDDSLLGGGGNDVLDGGAGIDQLFGQGGSDTFVHRTGEGSGNSATPDVIADFQGAGGGGFPEDDFLFLDVLSGSATFAPAGGGLAADVWRLTDGAVTEYLKMTDVTALVQGVDYGFF